MLKLKQSLKSNNRKESWKKQLVENSYLTTLSQERHHLAVVI